MSALLPSASDRRDGDLHPGRALDAGCGHGSETLWLAARAWQVTAVDFTATAPLKLVGEQAATPAGAHRARRVDSSGTMARVHLLVDELPHYTGMAPGEGPQHRGFTLLGGTPDVFQRCWEAQERGDLADEYPVELIIQSTTDSSLAPPGMHTTTTGVQQLPYHLRTGTWESRQEELTEKAIATIGRYAPSLPGAIRGSATITPLDIEREYGLTGGNIFQGALTLDQLFAGRASAATAPRSRACTCAARRPTPVAR